MNLNLVEILSSYVQIPAVIFCLCFGYVIKNTKPFEKWTNGFIPLYLAISGIIIAVICNLGDMTPQIVIAGMFSGLASSGLYDLFVAIVERKNKEKE